MRGFITAFIATAIQTAAIAGQGGMVAFVNDYMRYQERDGIGTIGVSRTGGAAGVVTVKLNLLHSQGATTQYDWAETAPIIGWADGEEGEKSVTFLLNKTTRSEGTTYFEVGLELVSGTDVEVSTERYMVCITDSTRLCFERPVYELSMHKGVPVTFELPVLRNGAGGVLSERVVSGKLPPSFSVTYSSVKNALLLSGTLTSSQTNTYSFSLRPVATIAGCGLLQTIIGEPSDFTITVKELGSDMPKLTEERSYPVVPLYWEGSTLAGTVDVSISAAQRITARFVGAKGKLTFQGTWSMYDAESKLLVAYLEKKKNVLILEVEADGKLTASMYPTANMSHFGDAEHPISGSISSGDAVDCSGYTGIYTVQLPIIGVEEETDKPIGDASLTLTVDSISARTGKIKYQGIMPDGTKLSGSSMLFPGAHGEPLFAICQRKGKETFGAVLRLFSGNSSAWSHASVPEKQSLVSIADGTEPYYLHSENGYYNLQGLAAHGGAWRANVGLDAVCDLFKTGREFNFVVRTDLAKESERVGSFAKCPTNVITVTGARRISATSAPIKKLKLSYKATNGTISGSATIVSDDGKSVAGKFQGVVMPGWQDRPFASGAFWFKDMINGLSRNRSLPFEIWLADEKE